MIDSRDVWLSYKRNWSLVKGKGFRVPKDWEVFKGKMVPEVMFAYENAAANFNTKWQNVDIDTFMKCGFDLYKSFTPHMFEYPTVIKHYIEVDKQKKRVLKVSLEVVTSHMEKIKELVGKLPKREGWTPLRRYCAFGMGNVRKIVVDYIKNKVDPLILTYCIYKGYIVLSDEERELSQYIGSKYRELESRMLEMKSHIEELDK